MDVLLTDADIITMAANSGPARSMLVRDDRIVAVGPAERVRAAAPGARVVGLDGAAVIPGLIDAHCHLCNLGYLAAGADCGQPAAPDIPAILARLRDAVARTPEGSWVTGSGYVEYKLREGRHPTRADLDAAVPGRPGAGRHRDDVRVRQQHFHRSALRAPGAGSAHRKQTVIPWVRMRQSPGSPGGDSGIAIANHGRHTHAAAPAG